MDRRLCRRWPACRDASFRRDQRESQSILSFPSAGRERFAPQSLPASPTMSPESSTFAQASASTANAGAGELWLATSPTVADAAEKLRLASAYKASLVDMEAAQSPASPPCAAYRSIVSRASATASPTDCPTSIALSPAPAGSSSAGLPFCHSSALSLALAHPNGRK